MTALDDWIKEIEAGTYSINPQNLISKTSTAIAALELIQQTTGLPGGSPGQVQFNSAGIFGGISGVTSDGTSLTVASGDLKLSGSGSGTAVLNAPAAGGGTLTLPAGTTTLAGLATAQQFTAAQTFRVTGASFGAIGVLGGVAAGSGINVGFNNAGTAGNAVLLYGSGANGGVAQISTNFLTTDGLLQVGTFTTPTAIKIAVAGGVTFANSISVGTSITFANNALPATTVTLADGSGAQLGTLTNAPAAGNPTKWASINDNGTTRFVPMW